MFFISNQRNSIQKKEIKKHLFRKYGKKKTCPCFYCRKKLHFHEATIEHLHPVSLGGNWHFDNLRISCRVCNNSRGVSCWRKFKEKWDIFFGEEITI